MKQEKKLRNSIILKAIKKTLKIRHLVLLFLLLSTNTFAWFIYNTQVNNSIDVHVKSWKIVLKRADNPIADYINFNIDSVYPGMQTYSDTITVSNESEVGAYIQYKILEADVLGDQYITVEGREDKKQAPQADDITSEELERILANNYPFEISFSLDTTHMSDGIGEAYYNLTVSWDYESGDDELDTEYGLKAYNFMKSYPGRKCITIKVKLEVGQTQDQATRNS